MISEELADRNKLKIGDKLTISSFNYITGERYGNTLELEIVGIFQMNFEEQVSKYTTESDIISNLIFTDEEEFTNWWTGEWNEYYNEDPIVPLEDPVVTYVTLYVDDPGMLKEVEDEIRGIDDKIDWEYYNFEYYDKDYKAIAKPLLLMVKLSTALMIIMAVGALVILSFILSMWIQGRKKEIHILSLIGIKKRSILAQIVLECTLVSICAFILAGAAAGPITVATGKALEKSVSSVQSDQPYETSRNVNGEVEIYRTSNEPVMLEYNLTLVMAVKVLAVMLAVIILSVLISFMRIEGRGRGKIRIQGF
ncbi:MAG: ABC transporter permease [[Clostridium] scindens]